MNVLFVDDETRVLEGIRRSMFGADKSWKIFCASSATAALELMDQTAMDVVISDMRMPEHDGAWLLTEVMQRYPECIRYVLSGQADEAEATRAIRVTHKFLRKPLTPVAMREAISSAAELLSLTRDSRLRRIVGVVDTLPTMPSCVIELRALLDANGTDVRSVAAIIERDPVIAAKVLQLVNSSFFSRPERVHDVMRAVTVIGVELVVRIALLVGVLPDEARNGKLDVDRMRQHAFEAAKLAKQLSPLPEDERAATAALLCDIGQLVLAQQASAVADLPDTIAGESELFGCTHAEVGAYLLALWGLPKELVEAVRRHHEPISIDALVAGDIVAVTSLAHLIADGAEVPVELRRQPVLGERIARALQTTHQQDALR